MNKFLIATCFTLACGFAVNAAAQDAAAQANGAAQVSNPDQNAKTDKAASARIVPAPGDRNCLRSTGSLIPPPKDGCLPVSGRSYSSTDIQRTGATNLGQALQQLDPSVQISGN